MNFISFLVYFIISANVTCFVLKYLYIKNSNRNLKEMRFWRELSVYWHSDFESRVYVIGYTLIVLIVGYFGTESNYIADFEARGKVIGSLYMVIGGVLLAGISNRLNKNN